MARGPEIPLWKRHVIGGYAWQLKMPLHEIAAKLGVTRQSIGNMLKRAKEHCNDSDDLDILMDALKVRSRAGRPQRAPPGSDLALLAREAVEVYPNMEISLAVNRYLKEVQGSGGIDPHIRPLAAQQVYNIVKPKKDSPHHNHGRAERTGRGTASSDQPTPGHRDDPHSASLDATDQNRQGLVRQGGVINYQSTDQTSSAPLALAPDRTWTWDGHAAFPASSAVNVMQEGEIASRGIDESSGQWARFDLEGSSTCNSGRSHLETYPAH